MEKPPNINKIQIQKANKDIAEGKLTLWNARLDLLLKIGDPTRIEELLAHSPVADGLGCDCGCSPMAGFERIVQPGAGLKKR